MPITLKNSDNLWEFTGRILAILAIFCLVPFPNIAKVALPAALLCSALSGNWHQKYLLLKDNMVVIASLIFLGLVIIGITYSVVPSAQIAKGLFKYTKILYLLFLVPLFTDKDWRTIAFNTLTLSIFIDIGISYLFFHGVTIPKNIYPGGFMQYSISVSMILGFLNFIWLNRVLDTTSYLRYLALGFLIFGTYALFFLYQERTGQLVFLTLIGLTLWQRLGWRGLGLGILVLPLLTTSLLVLSPKFATRVKTGAQEVITFIQTQEDRGSSLGLRLAFARFSLKAIKQHPIIGHGTGSFTEVYAATGGPTLSGNPNDKLWDPHNEYLITTVQLGIVGLLLLILWLLAQWVESFQLPLLEQRYLQGVICTFIVASFCNNTLITNVAGKFYIIFLGVYLAARYDRHLTKL